MLSFSAPAFLLAGALLATVPVALHMLARTPPERRPLPTARFLTIDRRTRLRLRPPTDRLLLALRVLFLLLLATAFARPEWQPDRAGSAVVVLLDAGNGMGTGWDEAVDAAAARLGDGGSLVVFDTTARAYHGPDAATLDSIRANGPAAGPTAGPAAPAAASAPSRYLAALRGLRAAAGGLPAESASAVLITRPRWDAWLPALPYLREAAWPGAIEVVAVGDAEWAGEAGGGRDTSRPRVAIRGGEDDTLRPFVSAALRSLGHEIEPNPGTDTAAVTGTAAVTVILDGADLGEAGNTATGPVVRLGGSSRDAEGRSPTDRGRLVLPSGRSVVGWHDVGAPAAGSDVIAVWEDGRPAAAVDRAAPCTAHLAAEPATPAAAADPAFPRLLDALVQACDSDAEPADAGTSSINHHANTPLDAGALSVLRGDAFPGGEPPAEVAVASVGGARGHALWRVALLLALLVALAEAAVAYVVRRSR